MPGQCPGLPGSGYATAYHGTIVFPVPDGVAYSSYIYIYIVDYFNDICSSVLNPKWL